MKKNSHFLAIIIAFLITSSFRFFFSCPVQWTKIADEAWYASSANTFFHSLKFVIGGEFNSHTLPLYSVVISPAYYFQDMDNTFTAIKLINSLVMSSAIFPIFLLARRFLSFRPAFIAAIFSVIIGPMFYTFRIMSENLHYPLIMWIFYLSHMSFLKEDKCINIILGIIFGLSLLNKLSSLIILLCYIVMLGFLSNKLDVRRLLRTLPIKYISALHKYRHVFIAALCTVLPYLVYRGIAAQKGSVVPYSHVWKLYFHNIIYFDIVKYAKWSLIYLGQLNLSTGLFFLPLSIFTILFTFRSARNEERILGISTTTFMIGILGLAAFQSGYGLDRVTERHFFVLYPFVFILSFLWLTKKLKGLARFSRFAISFIIIICTGFALFFPSWSSGPAVDSAFLDGLKSIETISAVKDVQSPTVRAVVFIGIVLLISIISFVLMKRKFGITVTFLGFFMVGVGMRCNYTAIEDSRMLRQDRLAIMRLIDQSVTYPSNLVFLGVPRFLALDHILWNKDSYSKILWRARERLVNTSEFSFERYKRLQRDLNDGDLTYLISPFFRYEGASLAGERSGIGIYKTRDIGGVAIKDFHIDFGAPFTREVLREGWSGNEGPLPRIGFPTFVWAVGLKSVLDIYSESVEFHRDLVFRVNSYPAEQSMHVVFNGMEIDTIEILPGWNEYRVRIPSDNLRVGKNSLTFNFKRAQAPSERGGRDTRKLAMAFDWLKIE